MESLTAGQSSMSGLMSSSDLLSATFLQALAAGRLACDARVGPIVARFGLDPVLASLSLRQAKELGLLTIVTSGRTGDISSRSDALTASLANRLRQQLHGSILCEVIWKPWITPWGQSLWKPRARVRTTFATATGSWPHAQGYRCKAGQSGIDDGAGSWSRANGRRNMGFANGARPFAGQQAGAAGGIEGEGDQREWLGDAVAGGGEGIEWVVGADGKARPVKSGLCLLASLVPHRVAKLRGLGNAIDIKAATAFVKAVMAI